MAAAAISKRSDHMDSTSPHGPELRRAHPLAIALIERLRVYPRARVLELGSGSGRNTAALEAAGFDVCSIPDAKLPSFSVPAGFDGAIATHAMLHGTPATVAGMVAATARALKSGGPFYATFASVQDARFGTGTKIDEQTFAPVDGDERGVAHVYFDEARLRVLLERHFTVESLRECSVDDVVGRWAHSQKPHGSVHWFVHACKPTDQ